MFLVNSLRRRKRTKRRTSSANVSVTTGSKSLTWFSYGFQPNGRHDEYDEPADDDADAENDAATGNANAGWNELPTNAKEYG